MKKQDKEIFIFTSEETADEKESGYIDNYINQLISPYTVIMSENNQNIIENEEGDAFMIMEYK